MWWLLPIAGAGLAVAAILNAVSDSEREARQNWEDLRDEVERTVEEHRLNIEEHLAEIEESYEFHVLVDLHYSSFRVADQAYSLLRDAKTSLNAIKRMLDKSRKRKKELKSELDRLGKGNGERKEVLAEIRVINDFRQDLFNDLDEVRDQKQDLADEVQLFNERTRELKYAIRDRCGWRGEEWYERLEERIRRKRQWD